MTQNLVVVESEHSFPEQHFLAANVRYLPQYLQSPEGQPLVKMLVEGLGKMMGGEGRAVALIQFRPPIPGAPPDDGDYDEQESIAMEGKIVRN